LIRNIITAPVNTGRKVKRRIVATRKRIKEEGFYP